MRSIVASGIIAVSLCAWGCSSSTEYGASPIAPTPAPAATPTPPPPPPPPPTSSAVTIDVVGVNGAQSFSPNPATLPAGQMVIWRNVDSVTHRVVLNSGALDTGNIAPGASSQPMAIDAGSGGYFCSLHPSMVGSIVRGS